METRWRRGEREEEIELDTKMSLYTFDAVKPICWNVTQVQAAEKYNVIKGIFIVYFAQPNYNSHWRMESIQ